MRQGQKLQYIGKGFLGFNPEHTAMVFSMNDIVSKNHIWVNYFNGFGTYRIIVRKTEVLLHPNQNKKNNL